MDSASRDSLEIIDRVEAVLAAAIEDAYAYRQRYALYDATYPEALTVVRAATEVMNRYSEQGHCDDSASWAGFDRLDRALAAFLAKAQDATEAGS